MDYLNGLNGYTVNIKNSSNLYYNEKIMRVLKKNAYLTNLKNQASQNGNGREIENFEINFNISNNHEKTGNMNFNSNEDTKISPKNYSFRNFHEIENYKNNNHLIVIFLKNLIFYQKYDENNSSFNYSKEVDEKLTINGNFTRNIGLSNFIYN